jgi:hypothetical protein
MQKFLAFRLETYLRFICANLWLNKKRNRPQLRVEPGLRAVCWQKLFLLLARGGGGLGGSRFGGALLELVHAAGGVHELLLAGVKRMAGVANTNQNGLAGGAGLDDVAARATDFRGLVSRMNVCFHKIKGRGK